MEIHLIFTLRPCSRHIFGTPYELKCSVYNQIMDWLNFHITNLLYQKYRFQLYRISLKYRYYIALHFKHPRLMFKCYRETSSSQFFPTRSIRRNVLRGGVGVFGIGIFFKDLVLIFGIFTV